MKILISIFLILLSSCGSKKKSQSNEVIDFAKIDFSLIPAINSSVGDRELFLQSAPLIHEIKDVETFIENFDQTYNRVIAAKENGDVNLIQSQLDHLQKVENFCIAHQDIVWGLHELERTGSDSCFLKQIKPYLVHEKTTYLENVPEIGSGYVPVKDIFTMPGVRFIGPYIVTVMPRLEEKDRYSGNYFEQQDWPAGYSNQLLKLFGENRFTDDYRVLIVRSGNESNCVAGQGSINTVIDAGDKGTTFQPMHMRWCNYMPLKIEFLSVAEDGHFYIKSVIRNDLSTNWTWTFHTGKVKEGNGGYLVYDHTYGKTFHISSNSNIFSFDGNIIKLTNQEQIILSMNLSKEKMLTHVRSNYQYRIKDEWRSDIYETLSHANYTGTSFHDFRLLSGSASGKGIFFDNGSNISWQSSGSFSYGSPYQLTENISNPIPNQVEVQFSNFIFPMTINLFPWHAGPGPDQNTDYAQLPDWFASDPSKAFLDPDPTWTDYPDNHYRIIDHKKVKEIYNECTLKISRPKKLCGQLYDKRKKIEELLRK